MLGRVYYFMDKKKEAERVKENERMDALKISNKKDKWDEEKINRTERNFMEASGK